MSEFLEDGLIGIVRRNGSLRWYRADRETWVLDWPKWRDDFLAAGHEVPELDFNERFGIAVVDDSSAEAFLSAMATFEVDVEALRDQFDERYPGAASWWDVEDLFPSVFVDFDRHELAAFYADGIRYERYVPNGWVGRFIDFSNEYPAEIFPITDKFWIADGVDRLKMLNDKAAKGGG